jgi:hypothetical protein
MAKKQKVSVTGWLLTVEYPTIGKKFTADISKYPAEMRDELTKHGAKQKFGDAESGGSPAEKYAMVQRIHEGLMSGQWELTSTPDMSGIVAEAVARLKKIKPEQVLKIFEKSPDKVKEFASNVKVKAEIAKIRAERAAKVAEEADEDLDIQL